MSLTTNFNFNPYYDDYDENKKFLRVLFKPGYSVQARELTQIQTLLQKQIQRFGNHTFVNGSAVIGGQTHFQNSSYLKLRNVYNPNSLDETGDLIDVKNFANKIIFNNDLSKRADVVVAIPANPITNDPPTLMINQIFGEPFTENEIIRTSVSSATDTPFFARISNNSQPGGNSIGTGQTFSIEESVFYYNGFFIKTDAQSVAVSKYDTTSASLKVGFEVNEYFISALDDATLVDPAQEATNYQAPGADRYKVEMILATRNLNSTDDLVNFIELAQFKNGVLQSTRKNTIYNKITDELARRTYDESGSYVVKNFSISANNTANDTTKIDVSIGPGKAYVFGYEVSMDYPQVLTVPKAISTQNTVNKTLTASYGNFFYTTNHSNTFNFNSLEAVDLHCVTSSNITLSSSSAYNNTKIGSAKVKSLEFLTSSNSQIGSTYTYSLELFDVEVANLTSTVVSTSTTNTKINIGSTFSSVNSAYTGALLQITSGLGSGEGRKLITQYEGSSRICTVFPPFNITPDSSSIFSIDFNVQDVESIVKPTTAKTGLLVSADISRQVGIDPTTINDETFKAILFDNKIEELIFNVGNNFVKGGTLASCTYEYNRLFSGSFGAASTLSLSTEFAYDEFYPVSSAEDRRIYYTITAKNTVGSYSVGKIIPSHLYTIAGSGTNSITITLPNSNGLSVDVVATMRGTVGAKTKAYVSGNTSVVALNGVEVVNGVTTYNVYGQVAITADAIVRTPETEQSLYMVDVFKINKILDFNGLPVLPTNVPSAIDVTDRYRLDTGQRDSFYDHASIRLLPGREPPKGPIGVYVDRFNHVGESGPFTVNSYPANKYEEISSYVSSGGKYYELRDCLDFRPSVKDSVASKPFIVPNSGPRIPRKNSPIYCSYEYYLPRIDKIFLSSTGSYDYTLGVPSSEPASPKDKSGSITLYEIEVPAYTYDLTDIDFRMIDNRRYTMKDIGQLEKRLKNLEYYTTLSLLENDAMSKSDVSLFGRSKNGIITDSFVGFSVVDTTTNEFNSAIDEEAHELRASSKIKDFTLAFDPTFSKNFSQSGSLVFLSANSNFVLAEQKYATKAISVNPYNVQLFIGVLRLKPQSDIWIDINRLPDIIIQDPNAGHLREEINEKKKWAEIQWGSWRTLSIGSRNLGSRSVTTRLSKRWYRNDTYSTTEIKTNQMRTGTKTYFVPEDIKISQGERVISSKALPYMRKKEVIYSVKAMKPLSQIYAFFDNDDINNYVSGHNYFTIDSSFSSIETSTTIQNKVPFSIYQHGKAGSGSIKILNSGSVVGNAVITMISGNKIYVDDVQINSEVSSVSWSSNNIYLQSNYNENPDPDINDYFYSNVKVSYIDSYNYSTGLVNVASEQTTTSIVLSKDAKNANLKLVLNDTPITVIADYTSNTSKVSGSNFKAKITAWNNETRTLTVDSPLNINPKSIVQIGPIKTDLSGAVSGSFYIPHGTFKCGEKKFRLTDNPTGDFGEGSCRADETFYAQGMLNTVEETLLATVRPKRVVEDFTENKTLVTISEERVAVGIPYKRDPVAETFLVEPTQHPDGVYLSKVRVCFKNKDEVLPVILQIRPTVNGYPSATQIVPFSEVTLLPSQVKVTDYPDLDDISKYTEFVFESPVYLNAAEHSVVLLSNSNLYEVYIATKDEKDINSGSSVSNQPFTGSFFKSQNGQTWTAEQESDLMFRIYYNQFSDDPAIVDMIIDPEQPPEGNTNFDLLVLQTQEVEFGNTTLTYSFDSEIKGTGGNTGFAKIIANEDVLMLDKFGSRVINGNNWPDTFVVRAELSTRNKDVSPILDMDRFGILAIEQVINNLSISNSDIVLANTGSYANGDSSNITISISGTYGTGATAKANVVYNGSTNVIDKIVITNGGKQYKTSPKITITSSSQIYPAVASVNGEDKKREGNSLARYITKKIALADGFSSGDLRVYITAHKPADSSIDVYYKLLAAGDKELWQDKEWQLMTQIEQAGYYSETYDDFAELVFAPGTNNKPSNAIEYTSATSGKFYEFNTFAIKIVLSGTNTVDVPRITDFRAIAIPSI